MTNKAYTPLTEAQQVRILNNVVASCSDIEKLSKQAYDFLYMSSGFIAHFNREGFKGYYASEGNLRADILAAQRFNQFHNFTSADSSYEKKMTQKHLYNAICLKLQNSRNYIG